MVKAAYDRLTKATETPPAPDPTESPKPSAEQKRIMSVNYRARMKSDIEPLIKGWSDLIELRLRVAQGQGSPEATLEALRPLPGTWATAEMMSVLAAQLNRPSLAEGAKALREALNLKSAGVIGTNVTELAALLPEAEIQSRVPPYRESNGLFTVDGYRQHGINDQGALTVSFRCYRCTGDMAEDAALIRAADLARRDGKNGFIILGRRVTKYSVTTTNYGVPARSDPNGFSAEFDVVFVDQLALPAVYAKSSWRVIDTDALFETMSGPYPGMGK